jgi:hypothetical protein
MNRRRLAVLAAAVVCAPLLSGCIPQAICAGDAYPVMRVGGTGRQCVAEGAEPPAGFVRFPAGKVPEKVDDEWDVYWRTHTLDESGTTVEVAAG